MRFSRFWCKKIIQSNVFHFIILRWDPSTHPWGHNPKSIAEIHGPYIYICFLLIGIVGSYMFDMFFVCNPGTKPGGTSNGTACHFCSPGTTAWIPAAQRIFHVPKPPIRQGRWLVAHHFKLPAVDGWKISLKSSSQVIPSLKLRRCPWKVKVGTWNFLFCGNFGLFSGTTSVSWRLLSHKMSDVLVQSSPSVWEYHVPIKRKWRVCLNC